MHPFFDVPRPVVIGHRGAAGIRPENTLLSFETALEQGARILESDVQITRDGVPILLHDPSVDRTTQGRGEARRIDLAELRRLDAGHAFRDETGATVFRGRGLRIPTLQEAFEAFPEARFNLEIKTDDPRATAATLDLVQRYDRAERTLLTAGEDGVMGILREALLGHPAVPAVGACLAEIVRAVQGATDGSPMAEGVMALQIPATFSGRPLVTPELVDYAHARGVSIHVWTINDLREIEALLALGVDGIVTDHPGRMARWLQRDLPE
jgi:glycerophosphoryl diester phosphodiesterase